MTIPTRDFRGYGSNPSNAQGPGGAFRTGRGIAEHRRKVLLAPGPAP